MSAPAPPPLASVMLWQHVCRMLDKVQREKKKKKDMLLIFIARFRELYQEKLQYDPDCQDTFFPVMRVLLPALDRARGAYGMKERRLADLYIRILGLPRESEDAKRLIKFRSLKSVGGGESGDFAEAAYYVLRNRSVDEGKMTLKEVDEQLSSIAENHAAKNHAAVEQSLTLMRNNMSAGEQKWLLRVLLKDMRLGLGQTAIFECWHPDAKDYYEVTNSLEKVCKVLKDPSVRQHELEVSLFAAFRPMLAQRAVLEKVETQMNNKTYFAETKFDGERSQIHKRGGDYKYFSRNGFDYTSNFGCDRDSGVFTPHLHPQLAAHVKEVMLDGEMVGWSNAHHAIVSKGELLDVKHLKEQGDWQVCFCAFDILLLNGQVLTNKPLSERLAVLRSVLKPREGRVIISDTSQVKSREEVVAALNEAIDRREEGVVLKDPDSVYRPAARRGGWIKVKPEYVDSLVPELDLVILGGFYGKGQHRGVISHFLLGVAVPSDELGQKPRLFHSFTRVGSGYTVDELRELVERLRPHTRPPHRQPPSVCVGREKTPDVWVDPCKSFVVQVRAAEVVKSDLYRTGVTLRFPRVERVRYDKPWHQVLNTTELKQLVQEAKGKLALKHCGDDLGDGRPGKRRAVARGTTPALPPHFMPADTTSAVKKDEIFGELEMCVINGDQETTKQGLETLMTEHGATLTQHPGPNTHCIIANDLSFRVQNCISSGQYNVVRPGWVVASCSSGRLLPWGPLHVLHLTAKEREVMLERFDPFGDSYTEPTDGRTLMRVMAGMGQESWRPLSAEEMSEMDERLNAASDSRTIFRRVVACFCEGVPGVEARLAALTLRLHGGTLTHSPQAATHLIAGEESVLRAPEFEGRYLVTVDWVTACVERGKRLEERLYMPRLTD